MNATTIIELKGIRRSDARSQRVILDGITLKIDAGECLGLIGPSGSGKSTLLRAIARLDPVEEGEIKFLGSLVAGDQVPPYRRNVIYVAQHAAFVEATLRDDLLQIFQFKAAQQDLNLRDTESLLTQFGQSTSMLDQPVEQLSGGEKQIAALVRAMALSPLLLLLDEPTASLDAVATEKTESVLKSWLSADAARAVVWVSHDQQQINRVATRIIKMNVNCGIES